MNSKHLWTAAATTAFATAAIMIFGTGQTVFAVFWLAAGCMFLVFAFTISGRS